MVTISDAQQIVASQNVSLSSKKKVLYDAIGDYLATDILGTLNLPPFDNAAMDGYAVSGYEEMYNIIGEVAAGDLENMVLKEGQASRIFTGARIPEGTTAVIMQEKTKVKGKLLRVLDEVQKGKNIRRKGEEISEGALVFEKGQPITAATVGVLSSLGLTHIDVYEKPVVSIITTGNELIQPGNPILPGQIYESNSATLKAALFENGFLSIENQAVKDDYDKIKWTIGEQLAQTKMLLISGGISVGEYDFVKKALEENDVEELFYKVQQKPGKPLFFGKKGETFVFALPGNPASALTCLYFYVLPLLKKMSGSTDIFPQMLKLPLAEEYVMKSDRPIFFKAKVEEGKAHLMTGQGSSMLHSLALGCAIVFLEKSGLYRENDLVKCYLI